MDITKKIVYNSLTLNGVIAPVAGGAPMSGYQMTELQPASVGARAYESPRALHDGRDSSLVFLDNRTFSGIVTVFGSTKADFWDKTQDLLAAFSPTLSYAADSTNLGYLPFDFTQPTGNIASWPTSTYPDGMPLRYYLRPTHPPLYVIRRDEDGGVDAKGLSKQFRVTLEARDPRKYAQTAQTIAIATGTATAQGTAAYRGDYPSGDAYIVLIAGFSPGGSTAVFSIEGSTFTITGIGGGQTYTLDLDNRTLFVGTAHFGIVTTPAMGQLTWTAWPDIGPASNTPIVLQRKFGTTAAMSMSLTFREAFA